MVQYIMLPRLERSILKNEQENVALGLLGMNTRLGAFFLAITLFPPGLFLENLGRIDERVHVVLALKFARLLITILFARTKVVTIDLLTPLDVR